LLRLWQIFIFLPLGFVIFWSNLWELRILIRVMHSCSTFYIVCWRKKYDSNTVAVWFNLIEDDKIEHGYIIVIDRSLTNFLLLLFNHIIMAVGNILNGCITISLSIISKYGRSSCLWSLSITVRYNTLLIPYNDDTLIGF